MIREFTIDDLERFEPNEFSAPGDVMTVLKSEDWWNYTLENHGQVKAIICFTEQDKGEWAAFCLIGKQFNARDTIELKRFTERAALRLQPKQMWTISRQKPYIDKWHQFQGMEPDGEVELNGEIYSKWTKRWHESRAS
jgi:hypothetical protein